MWTRNLAITVIFLSIVGAASAAPITLTTVLSGANELPPTGSSGTGTVTVIVDPTANTLHLDVAFSGLGSNDIAAHIHCCAPQPSNVGVATVMPAFPGFPLGVTSGTLSQTYSLLDAAFYNAPFLTASGGTAADAEAALITGLLGEQTYFNIHTVNFGGGEIRGVLTPIPEPATTALLVPALATLWLIRRRRG